MSAARHDIRDAARICAIAAAAAAAIALLVHAFAAETARDALAFTFPGIESTWGGAAAIFANNARKLAGVLALALMLQVPWMSGERAADDRPDWHRRLAVFTDSCLLGVLAATFLAVAAGIGAYGTRMLAAILPHGPLELAAFAVAVVLYRHARRGRVEIRRAAVLAASGLALLAVAAPVEVFTH